VRVGQIGLIFVLLLAVSATTASAATPGLVAADEFRRIVSAGWGSAQQGGAWKLEGSASAFAVNGSEGVMNLSASGTNLAAMLGATVLNAELSTTVSVDRAPLGGSVRLYGELRRNGANSYRVKVRLAPDGGVFVAASRVVNSAEVTIRPEVRVAALDYRDTAGIRMRGQVQGTSPSTLRVRAWAAGAAEPSAWQFVGTDSTVPLQGTGAIGLRSYLSGDVTNEPIHVSVDDFAALNLDGSAPPPAPADPVFIGAGDIASCGIGGDEQTASLLDGIEGTVYTLGDNVYPNGSPAEFANCYAPSWGRHKVRTVPVIGNHEYNTAKASGYFGYFGAAAGAPTKGYYSFDLGAWHIIVLNANCSFVSCAEGSTQEQWLKTDLAAHSNACTAALWHQPRFSSGSGRGTSAVGPFWADLYSANADLILNAHDHDYERFAPQTPNQAADTARGIREFIVGTGGESNASFGKAQPNSQVRNGTTFGVLKLTLHPSSYDWLFLPVAGRTFTDRGSTACH
jgi:acid phosphatase type 7